MFTIYVLPSRHVWPNFFRPVSFIAWASAAIEQILDMCVMGRVSPLRCKRATVSSQSWRAWLEMTQDSHSRPGSCLCACSTRFLVCLAHCCTAAAERISGIIKISEERFHYRVILQTDLKNGKSSRNLTDKT